MLQFQNLKLVQKLEAQKVECTALENKYSQLRDKQLPYDNTLEVVHKAWEEVSVLSPAAQISVIIFCNKLKWCIMT